MNIYDLIIVQPILNALMTIYTVMPWGDFGLALIIFTVIVRFLMYPLVRRQLHQTKMMRKLQPKLKEIKKNAKGNRQVEAMQMMELYKRHGVSPFRSIGILLIQLPIFIGLYHAIQIFTLHRDRLGDYTYSFLESFAPVAHLIDNPETFNQKMLGFIDLTGHAISSSGIDVALFTLAVLAGVTQFIMSKQIMPHNESKKSFRQIMSEAAEGKQADQSEMNALVMQNMMKIMPFFMFMIMLNLPGALALYYTVSNLVAVGQQGYLLRQDEDELEEIADEPATESRTSKKSTAKTSPSTKVTRITAKDSRTKRAKKAKKKKEA